MSSKRAESYARRPVFWTASGVQTEVAAELGPFLTRAEPTRLRQQISQALSTRASCPLALRSGARGDIFQIARDPLQHLADLGTVNRDVLRGKLTRLAHVDRHEFAAVQLLQPAAALAHEGRGGRERA